MVRLIFHTHNHASMKTSILLSLALLSSALGFGQFRALFTEANILTEDGYYGLAIPIWRDLLRENPNANINYKLGSCYLNLGIDRDRALPFLIKASKDVAKVYDPFSSSFESAPIEVYYYLAKAYHINTDLDSAEKYYTKFLDEASKKQYLRPSTEKGLEMCATARELMANPLEVDIVNIGSPVNSKFAEYTPIVAYDENTLYFTSRRLREDSTNSETFDASTGLYYEDMYVSYRGLGGNWLEPELLNINVKDDHSSVVSMSPDGRKIYLYKIFDNNGNIYESEFQLGTGWTLPSLVGSNVNTEANEYFATVTSDDQTLYFVSDRKGGLGGKDIWYCKKLPTGDWGKAINLGAPINTPFDEDAPYLHPDGKTMYFSSNGHKSMGGYDIFYTQKQDDGKWSAPTNVGYPINTTDDDHSYVGTPSGKRAYYSSKGANTLGSTDIYVVDYNLEENNTYPEYDMSAFALIKGWVFAEAGQSLPNDLAISIMEPESENVIGEAKPVEQNGSFVFIVKSGASYMVDVSIGDKQVYNEVIEIPAGDQYLELSREIFILDQNDKKIAVGLDDRVLGYNIKWQLTTRDKKLLPLGTKVYYLNKNQERIDSAYVSKDGYFELKKLAAETPIILEPRLAIDIMDLEIELIDNKGNPMEKTMVNMDGVFYEKGEEPDMATDENQKEVADLNHPTTKPKIETDKESKTEDLKPVDEKPGRTTAVSSENTFRVPFRSNGYVKFNDSEVRKAVELIIQRLEAGKTTNVQIMGSASRVPTGFPGGNERLAELRAKRGKNALIRLMKEQGYDINKLSTFEVKSAVQGPTYSSTSNPYSTSYTEQQHFMIQVN